MTIHSIVELMIANNQYTSYEERLRVTKFISQLYLKALNKYFSSSSDSLHHTLTGLITESRINVFNPSELGLRGLLHLHLKELNESQWIFFRYAILEIVHCKYSYQGLLEELNSPENQDLAQKYLRILPSIIDSILNLRKEFINKGIDTSIKSKEFNNQLELQKAQLKGQGLLDENIETQVATIIKTKQIEVEKLAKENIKASLGELADKNKILVRLTTNHNKTEYNSGFVTGIDEFFIT